MGDSWREALSVTEGLIKGYHKLQGRIIFQGFPISIENLKGSVRRGVDRNGEPWETKLKNDYGYFRSTLGVDGDEVDVFIGPNKYAKKVYIVRAQAQDRKNSWKYDEDKVMLGFSSKSEARKAFLNNYDKKEFLGPIDEYDVEVFRDKLYSKKNKGKMVKSFVQIGDVFK